MEQRWLGLEPMHVAIKLALSFLGCFASIFCDAPFGKNRGQMDRQALAILDIGNLFAGRYLRSNGALQWFKVVQTCFR